MSAVLELGAAVPTRRVDMGLTQGLLLSLAVTPPQTLAVRAAINAGQLRPVMMTGHVLPGFAPCFSLA